MQSSQPPPPPPLPPSGPIYYPPGQSNPPSLNANRVLEDGRRYPVQTPVRSPMELLCLSVVHNLTQLSLGGIVISALLIPNVLSTYFFRVMVQHTVLCIVGYFVIMAQAILTFSPVSWTNSLTYESKMNIHSMMQVSGSILAIAGSAVQLADRNFTLSSSHGICGLVATIFTVINLIVGVVTFLFRQNNNKLFKLFHLHMSGATITLAFITLILAFHLYYRNVAGNANANLAIGLTVFALIGLLLTAFVENIKRILQKK